jgi:hypothetical protein
MFGGEATSISSVVFYLQKRVKSRWSQKIDGRVSLLSHKKRPASSFA